MGLITDILMLLSKLDIETLIEVLHRPFVQAYWENLRGVAQLSTQIYLTTVTITSTAEYFLPSLPLVNNNYFWFSLPLLWRSYGHLDRFLTWALGDVPCMNYLVSTTHGVVDTILCALFIGMFQYLYILPLLVVLIIRFTVWGYATSWFSVMNTVLVLAAERGLLEGGHALIESGLVEKFAIKMLKVEVHYSRLDNAVKRLGRRFVYAIFAIICAAIYLLYMLFDRLTNILKRKPALHEKMEKAEKFKYERLPIQQEDGHPSKVIRLLRTATIGKSPDKDSPEPLKFELFYTNIDEAPEYEAISYTWGSPEKCREIFINDCSLLIPATAFEALQQRSHHSSTRTIWIDFVCINQEDDIEKGHQVGLMRDIYRRASRVIVFLGNQADSRTAIILFHVLWFFLQAFDRPREVDNILRTTLLGIFPSTLLVTLTHLLHHAWFARVWVVQEIVVAKEVHVVYGGWYIDWEDLTFVLSGLRKNPGVPIPSAIPGEKSSTLPGGADMYTEFVATLRTCYQGGTKLNLSEVISIAFLNATDDRDRIFALLGMTSSTSASITPDYTKDVSEVYLEAAKHFISLGELSDLLGMAGNGFPRKLNHLPSWVPDWSLRRPTSLTGSIGYHSALESRPDVELDTSNAILVKGHFVDTLSLVNNAYLDFTTQPESYKDIIDSYAPFVDGCIQSIGQQLATETEKYHNGQPFKEALWRTLLCDRGHANTGGIPTEDENGIYFEATIRHARAHGHVIRTSVNGVEFESSDSISKAEALHLKLEKLGIPAKFAAKAGDSLELPEHKTYQLLEDAGVELDKLSGYDVTNFLNVDHRIVEFMQACKWGRKFSITAGKFMGLVPPLAMPGDEVYIIYGTNTPFILRRVAGSGSASDSGQAQSYGLVGECYMHGMMNGELMNGDFKDRKIRIV